MGIFAQLMKKNTHLGGGGNGQQPSQPLQLPNTASQGGLGGSGQQPLQPMQMPAPLNTPMETGLPELQRQIQPASKTQPGQPMQPYTEPAWTPPVQGQPQVVGELEPLKQGDSRTSGQNLPSLQDMTKETLGGAPQQPGQFAPPAHTDVTSPAAQTMMQPQAPTQAPVVGAPAVPSTQQTTALGAPTGPGGAPDFGPFLTGQIQDYQQTMAEPRPLGPVEQRAFQKERDIGLEEVTRRGGGPGSTAYNQWLGEMAFTKERMLLEKQQQDLQNRLPMIDVAMAGWQFQETLGFKKLELSETLNFKREELAANVGIQKYGIDVDANVRREIANVQAQLGYAQISSTERMHAIDIGFNISKLEATIRQWGAENQIAQNKIDADVAIATAELEALNKRTADRLEFDKTTQMDKVEQWGIENGFTQEQIDWAQESFWATFSEEIRQFDLDLDFKQVGLDAQIEQWGTENDLDQQTIDNNLTIAREEIAVQREIGHDNIAANTMSDLVSGAVTFGGAYYMGEVMKDVALIEAGLAPTATATSGLASTAPAGTEGLSTVAGPGSGVSGGGTALSGEGGSSIAGPGSGVSTAVAPASLATTAAPTATYGPAGAASTGSTAYGPGGYVGPALFVAASYQIYRNRRSMNETSNANQEIWYNQMTPEQRAQQIGDDFISRVSAITQDPSDIASGDPRDAGIRRGMLDVWAAEEGISVPELEAKYSVLDKLVDQSAFINTSDRQAQGRDATTRLGLAEEIFNDSQGMTLQQIVDDGRIQDIVDWKYYTDAQIREMGINPTDVRPQGLQGPRGGAFGM